MKGAPERIIDRCSSIIVFDETVPFNKDLKKSVYKAISHLGLKGERVLAFADLHLPGNVYGPDYQFNADQQNFPLEGNVI